MPRSMSTAMTTWLTGDQLPVALFFMGTFQTGAVYLWTGYGSINWNGHTWLGLGKLGGIAPIAEASTVEAKGFAVTLSGIDATLLGDVLGEFQLNLPMATYIAGLNGGSIIADPLGAFIGRMDQPTVDIDGNTATIAINCESRFIEMNVAVERRYTADDQQRDWPGDLCFNFVNGIQELNITWGTAPTTQGNI
jgi:hypothetical protein